MMQKLINWQEDVYLHTEGRRFFTVWLLLIFLGLSGHCFAQPVQADVALPVRLHIMANSDSAQDQMIKLQVRDAVVEYLTPKLEGLSDHDAAAELIEAELPQLAALAGEIVKPYGYSAKAEFGVFYFTERLYGEVKMPAGDYRAVRITLGEGCGKNWWCVLFPPLCFADEVGKLSPAESQGKSIEAGAQMRVKSKFAEIFYIER